MSTAEIIGAILAVLNLVGGVIGKYIIDNLKEQNKELRERIERLEATNNAAVLQARVDAIVLEIAKFEGRVEQWTKDKTDADTKWRHGEYMSAITSINNRLYPLVTKMEAVEKQLERLENRILYGNYGEGR